MSRIVCEHGVDVEGSCYECAQNNIPSDGGSTPDLYGIPAVTDFTELCQWRGMLPYQYNVTKAAWRWGGKQGTDLSYDLRKIIYFATEALAELDDE